MADKIYSKDISTFVYHQELQRSRGYRRRGPRDEDSQQIDAANEHGAGWK